MDGIEVVSTLSDVITRLEYDPFLAPARRRDLISGVRRVSKITGVEPLITPASLRFMRPLINAVRPARHNVSPKTWSNLCSNFRAALVHALPRQLRQPDRRWEKLRTMLPNKRFRSGLSRFIGFCEREAIPPTAVSDEVLARFRAYLETDTRVPSPPNCHRRTCRLWNTAADSIPDWPQSRLRLPDHRRPRRSLPLSSCPASLQEEFEHCVAPLRCGDRFAKDGPRKPLRPSTVGKIRAEVELALSAIVEAGRDPASITSLRCLFEPDAFETALRRYLNNDQEQTPRPTAHNIASSLIGLARRIMGSDAAALDQLAELRRLRRCLGPQPKCLTEKNRTLLCTLDDPAVRAKLYFLPERLGNWAERMTSVHGAVAMQIAVAIVILQSAPLRIGNLAGLRLDRHLVRPGGPRSLWQIDIPPHEVKNNQALVFEFPRRATALVDRYIRRFRPSLAAPGNPYLFPVGSRQKPPHWLSQQIRRVLADWVGIDMTPHQFRHFAARVLQQHSPGAFPAIAQLLGHKDVRTAMTYADPDTLSAGRQFDELLEADRSKARLRVRGRS
jgi:integrase